MIEFLKNIIKSNTKESSKRFIAIWVMVLITAVVAVALWKDSDIFSVLASLIAFVCTLLGIATWQTTKKNDEDKE